MTYEQADQHWVRYTVLPVVLVLALLAYGAAKVDALADTPQAAVEAITADVLKTLQANRDVVGREPARVMALIVKDVYPYLDFNVMSREVLGAAWRSADDALRSRFMQAFRELLTDDYTAALRQFSNQSVKVTGTRWEDAAQQRAMVFSTVYSPAEKPVEVDYRLYRDQGKWMIYDVVVDGVSLLINYREEFAAELQNESVATLVSRLEEKVTSLRADDAPH
jgi:phospholipid transport system substrate-binding protein